MQTAFYFLGGRDGDGLDLFTNFSKRSCYRAEPSQKVINPAKLCAESGQKVFNPTKLRTRAKSGQIFRLLLGLLGQQHGLDIGQHTALSDGHATQQLVQLLVVPDGQLKMPGYDPGLLVVAGCVARQLENLSRQVLEHRGHVDGSSRANALSVVALARETADGELKARSGWARFVLGALCLCRVQTCFLLSFSIRRRMLKFFPAVLFVALLEYAGGSKCTNQGKNSISRVANHWTLHIN